VVTTDGATVVTSSEELGLSAWDMVTGHRLWTDEAGESWWLGLALTEDESCVLVAEDEERCVCRRLADGELVGEEKRSAELDSEKRFAWAGGSVISSRSGAHACVHLEQQIIPVQVEGAPRGC
jgi:hypothetical protein